MQKSAQLLLSLMLCIGSIGQTPSTKSTIQSFIDSIGNSDDRMNNRTGSIFPAVTDGTNPLWSVDFWSNRNKELLWVEVAIPDSISTVFFYSRDVLIFVGEMTYSLDSISKKRKEIFRNIFVSQSKIIEDSHPGNNDNTIEHYLAESKKYLEMFKAAD